MNPTDYTFSALLSGDKEIDPGADPTSSLCYLISLVDSPRHAISQTLPAKRILTWLYDFEEQAVNHTDLNACSEFFGRYFEGGFYPQTPCMIVRYWSPIEAMLERGIEPRVLNRETKFRAVATGIWEAQSLTDATSIESATTDSALFWAVMQKVSEVALGCKKLINIIAQPGWDYNFAISSLPVWPDEEVAQTGRVLWKRTPAG